MTADPHIAARLQRWAAERPHALALTVLGAEGEARFDYATLDRRARAIAATLQQRGAPGDRVLLLLDNDALHVTAFFACLYAGRIAVPAFPPESLREQHLARLRAIAADCAPACVLTSRAIARALQGALGDCMGPAVDVIEVDAVADGVADRFESHAPRPQDTAFLQYTSGSTASPKGVVVSHANIMANEAAIEAAMAVGPDDVFASWLPLFHDMGLIGGLLQPLHRGIPLVLMSPQYFLERPLRWLQAISRHRVTVSGGPDFAYRLCADRIKPSQLAGLDLSSWRVAFSGAEPVRPDTVQAFADRFAPAGFDPRAVYACYGLAEATLLVSGGPREGGLQATAFDAEALSQGRVRVAAPVDAQPTRSSRRLAACGPVAPGHALRIVDADSACALADGQVGEVWFSGPSVAGGYWQRPDASADSFVLCDGLRWLRTGDLGFVHGGQLHIAGRLKDLVILNGRNHHPQDIEQAVEAAVDHVRKGRVAAFAVADGQGAERVGVAVEVARAVQKQVPAAALAEAIQRAVSAACGEPAWAVLLLQPGALPKTSSGKLQRSACRQSWQQGRLASYAVLVGGRWTQGDHADDAHVEPAEAAALQGRIDTDTETDIETTLAALWRSVLNGDATLTRHDHFFTRGGDSLTAARLAARIAQQWRIDFSAAQVFGHPTLQAQAAEIDRRQAAGPSAVPATVRQPQASGPLSPAQRQQWFLWRFDPASAAYHLGGVLHLDGPLDAAALRAAWADLADRQASLRTVFRSGADGLPEQQVQPAAPDAWAALDLRDRPLHDRAPAADHAAQRLLREPFELTQAPPWRAVLLRLGEHQHRLVVVAHHIVCDGASLQTVLDELSAFYAARCAGRPAALPPLPVRALDHAAWLPTALSDDEAERQLTYWRAHLGDEHPVLALPTDRPRSALVTRTAAQCPVPLDAALTAALRERARAAGTTLFTVLLAGFQALLQRWTGDSDLRIGVPTAGRQHPLTDGLVGHFVGTQVLRVVADALRPLADLLAQARAAAQGAQAHADLPFERLVEALQPRRGADQPPLFQVMFNHRRQSGRSLVGLPQLQARIELLPEPTAQFDLVLDAIESDDGELRLRFSHAAELFEPASIARAAEGLRRLLHALATTPQQALGDVPLDDGAGLDGGPAPGFSAPVHERIAEQAARTPDAIAVALGDRRLRYAELDAEANRLAHRLRALGAGGESRVGLLMERSVGAVVAMLAVLKTGACYVPLDPVQPADRLARMLDHGCVALLLTQSPLLARLHGELCRPGRTVLCLDAEDLSTEPAHAPPVTVHGHQLAYIVYTSGSTGEPKAIGVPQQALARHTQVAIAGYRLTADDRVLQFASLGFDACVEQIYPALCAGATLVMRGPAVWRADEFHHQLQAHRITVADLTTAYWHLLAQDFAARRVAPPGHLRLLLAGGEAMPAEGLAAWQALGWPQLRLHNAYGPTEATVTAAAFDGTELPAGTGTVPIGHALAGRRLHVLDADLQPVLPGAAGELCIGGELLARGYLHRPGLTAERFIADPFDAQGGRLYRTGDRVRLDAHGRLQHQGRIDQQLKVRGFRVEPGEIEAALRQLPGVREAAVVPVDSAGGDRGAGPAAGPQLVAYVSPATDAPLDTAALREALALRLPEPLRPAAYVVLPALPVNASGKLDRKALPAPVLADVAPHEPPQGPAETALAALWAEVLGLARVGRDDHFFHCGGHSLAAVQLTALLLQRHGIELPVRTVFERPVLRDLAAAWPADAPGQAPRDTRLAEMARLLDELDA